MAGTETTVPILIVGGGIGGLAAALAIAQGGREVHLLEQAPQFTEIGAGLQVGPNATRVLDRLKLLDRALDLAVLPEHGVMLDAVTAERLTVLDLGEAFLARYGYPYVVLHRSDLLEILLSACREQPNITLENNKTVTEVWSATESAGVRCADGGEYHCELLIGADGLNSRVRTLIDDSEPRNSGYVAYRGTLPMSEVKAEVSANDVVLWIGPGLHLIQYPIRRHELYNQVAVFRSDQFPGGGQPYGTARELHARFSATCDEVRRHVSRIQTDRNWPIFDRDPLQNWIAGRATLLGDAAHPMLQYLGQGACQALEDAYELGRQLARSPLDIPAALGRFQERRIDRATRCQLSARPWGETWHAADAATVGLRNRVLRQRRADDYSELDWLYLDQDLAS
jgi:2-polyprenyl-6-methoxyphenol hydroxylase-like FAD-dependent oxidoreductase